MKTPYTRASKSNKSISGYFSVMVANSFQELLEKKHLYQGVTIDVSTIFTEMDKLEGKIHPGRYAEIGRYATDLFNSFWLPCVDGQELEPHRENEMLFTLPTVKTFCQNCDRVEAFNPYKSPLGSSPAVLVSRDKHKGKISEQQHFVLEYKCQSCKEVTTTFLVRRQALKLILCGRSPIEHVEVNKTTPKSQRKYVSDAIVAHNSGQTLAGLFLLRTFIEQYTRALAQDPSAPADKVIEAYMKELPEDFKQRFPSLVKLYSDLSGAIHGAYSSEELFCQCRDDLYEHFDAKKLFKIKDITPQRDTSSNIGGSESVKQDMEG